MSTYQMMRLRQEATVAFDRTIAMAEREQLLRDPSLSRERRHQIAFDQLAELLPPPRPRHLTP